MEKSLQELESIIGSSTASYLDGFVSAFCYDANPATQRMTMRSAAAHIAQYVPQDLQLYARTYLDQYIHQELKAKEIAESLQQHRISEDRK